MPFDFNEKNLKFYEDNRLPNINPHTGFRLHRTKFTAGISEYHTHDYYEIFLSLSGDTVHHVNNSQQKITPGSLVFIRPSDKHCYEMIGENKTFEFINFAFSKKNKDKIFYYFDDIYDLSKLTSSPLPPIIQLLPHDAKNLEKKFKAINSFPYNNHTEQQLSFRHILIDIIPKFFNTDNKETTDEIPYWLIRAYNEMHKIENFVDGITKMAEISNKTPEHLSRTLKKYYGISPSQLVTELRLNYATNLLTNTNMKIIDICFETGFCNLSTFYSIFCDVHGMTPKEYRKQYS